MDELALEFGVSIQGLGSRIFEGRPHTKVVHPHLGVHTLLDA